MESKFLNSAESLRIESDHAVLGYIGTVDQRIMKNAAIAELDMEKLMKLVSEEREYEPIAKYPAVERDISMFVSANVRVNDILEEIQIVSPKLVYDVDMVDYFQDEARAGFDKKSFTFRVVFQSKDRTLTDDEVNKEMEKILGVLKDKFGAEIR